MAFHVSKVVFEQLVEKALQDLPEEFARFLEEVPIEIQNQSTPAQRKRAGLKPHDLLLGLYHGRPLTQRSVEDSGRLPDIIHLFQHDIELCCQSESDLLHQVRTTLLHEIGHHFGLSEKDLKNLGYQ